MRIDFQTVSSLDKTPLNRDKQQKRSKAQSSPDSINFSSDKRPVPPDAYSAMMAQAHDLTMASQMSSPPPSQSILPQIPPYRPLPAKMSNLSFRAKTGFDIFAMIKMARFTRENFQAPIQSHYQMITMFTLRLEIFADFFFYFIVGKNFQPQLNNGEAE